MVLSCACAYSRARVFACVCVCVCLRACACICVCMGVRASVCAIVNCLREQVVDYHKHGLWKALLRADQARQSDTLLTLRGMSLICNFNQSWYLKFDAQE